MAWPPGVLAVNRTNATVQQDIHPADHNAVNAAVNDTVAQVQSIGNPWRDPATVTGNIGTGTVTTSPGNLAIASIAGSLGHTTNNISVYFDRRCLVVGYMNLHLGAASATGTIKVTVNMDGYNQQNQWAVLAGHESSITIPTAMFVTPTSYIYWTVVAFGTTAPILEGSFSYAESGPFGSLIP